MFNAVKWFAGFTVMQMMKNHLINVVSQESNCTVGRTAEEKLYADCANRQLTHVLRGLGDDIEVLNISSNPFEALRQDDLSEYTSVKELIMTDLNIRGVSQEFLMPLKELDVLDISSTTLLDAPKLPSTITKLLANRIQLARYDLSQLDNLREISLIGDNLEKLPTLNKSAPIVIMHLTENKIQHLDLVDLGNFCQLSQLSLESFQSGEQYAESCCYVRVWLDEYKVESQLKCEKQCDKEKYPANSEAIDAYDDCLRNAEVDENMWRHFALYVLVAVIFIVIIVIIGIKYYWSEDEPDAHPTTQTAVTEKETETAEFKDETVVEEENAEASH